MAWDEAWAAKFLAADRPAQEEAVAGMTEPERVEALAAVRRVKAARKPPPTPEEQAIARRRAITERVGAGAELSELLMMRPMLREEVLAPMAARPGQEAEMQRLAREAEAEKARPAAGRLRERQVPLRDPYGGFRPELPPTFAKPPPEIIAPLVPAALAVGKLVDVSVPLVERAGQVLMTGSRAIGGAAQALLEARRQARAARPVQRGPLGIVEALRRQQEVPREMVRRAGRYAIDPSKPDISEVAAAAVEQSGVVDEAFNKAAGLPADEPTVSTGALGRVPGATTALVERPGQAPRLETRLTRKGAALLGLGASVFFDPVAKVMPPVVRVAGRGVGATTAAGLRAARRIPGPLGEALRTVEYGLRGAPARIEQAAQIARLQPALAARGAEALRQVGPRASMWLAEFERDILPAIRAIPPAERELVHLAAGSTIRAGWAYSRLSPAGRAAADAARMWGQRMGVEGSQLYDLALRQAYVPQRMATEILEQAPRLPTGARPLGTPGYAKERTLAQTLTEARKPPEVRRVEALEAKAPEVAAAQERYLQGEAMRRLEAAAREEFYRKLEAAAVAKGRQPPPRPLSLEEQMEQATATWPAPTTTRISALAPRTAAPPPAPVRFVPGAWTPAGAAPRAPRPAVVFPAPRIGKRVPAAPAPPPAEAALGIGPAVETIPPAVRRLERLLHRQGIVTEQQQKFLQSSATLKAMSKAEREFYFPKLSPEDWKEMAKLVEAAEGATAAGAAAKVTPRFAPTVAAPSAAPALPIRPGAWTPAIPEAVPAGKPVPEMGPARIGLRKERVFTPEEKELMTLRAQLAKSFPAKVPRRQGELLPGATPEGIALKALMAKSPQARYERAVAKAMEERAKFPAGPVRGPPPPEPMPALEAYREAVMASPQARYERVLAKTLERRAKLPPGAMEPAIETAREVNIALTQPWAAQIAKGLQAKFPGWKPGMPLMEESLAKTLTRRTIAGAQDIEQARALKEIQALSRPLPATGSPDPGFVLLSEVRSPFVARVWGVDPAKTTIPKPLAQLFESMAEPVKRGMFGRAFDTMAQTWATLMTVVAGPAYHIRNLQTSAYMVGDRYGPILGARALAGGQGIFRGAAGSAGGLPYAEIRRAMLERGAMGPEFGRYSRALLEKVGEGPRGVARFVAPEVSPAARLGGRAAEAADGIARATVVAGELESGAKLADAITTAMRIIPHTRDLSPALAAVRKVAIFLPWQIRAAKGFAPELLAGRMGLPFKIQAYKEAAAPEGTRFVREDVPPDLRKYVGYPTGEISPEVKKPRYARQSAAPAAVFSLLEPIYQALGGGEGKPLAETERLALEYGLPWLTALIQAREGVEAYGKRPLEVPRRADPWTELYALARMAAGLEPSETLYPMPVPGAPQRPQWMQEGAMRLWSKILPYANPLRLALARTPEERRDAAMRLLGWSEAPVFPEYEKARRVAELRRRQELLARQRAATTPMP